MTAEVITYNKNAIAMAADSAVTVYGSKTYNSANKLFMLSKYHPVGILIYNSASINGIYTEILVKEYRKQLGKKSFDSLKEYKDNFILFLRDFLQTHISDEDKKFSIIIQLNNLFDYVFNRSDFPQINPGENFFNVANKFLEGLTTTIKQTYNIEKELDLSGIDLAQEIKNIFLYRMKLPDSEELNGLVSKLIDIFAYYINIPYNPNITGIAICGYGEKEFAPKIYNFETLGFINNTFKVKDIGDNESQDQGVIPLAQRDMTDLFIQGVDYRVYSFITEQYEAFIEGIADKIKKADVDLSRYIGANKYVISKRINEVLNKEKVKPLLDVIGILSKDELAELSESLVNLQALKHKMSLNLETVGGPVDVAIISKHDGFIWKKRKLYFDKELNPHFFENYFSEESICGILKNKEGGK